MNLSKADLQKAKTRVRQELTSMIEHYDRRIKEDEVTYRQYPKAHVVIDEKRAEQEVLKRLRKALTHLK